MKGVFEEALQLVLNLYPDRDDEVSLAVDPDMIAGRLSWSTW